MIGHWRQHPRQFVWTALIAGLLLGLAAVGWSQIRFTSAMEMMLPQHSEARQTIQFVRDSKFASRAILWFQLSSHGSEDDLFDAAEATIQRLDPALIVRIIRPSDQASPLEMMTELLRHQGDLLGESQLPELAAAMEPQALRQRMRDVYMAMVKPSGAFSARIIPHDPLGVGESLLAQMYGLTKALGFEAQIHRGHLVHPDGRQLMVLLETAAPVTDIEGSKALMAHLMPLAKQVGPHVTLTPIAGHRHTLQNDRLMREDITFVATVDLIAFAVLFLLVCRDWRIGMILFLPVVAISISIGLCGGVFSALATMVVGMAATMAGSAVDYGIHVYTAVRLGSDPFVVSRKIARPLLTGMLATMGVFVAFMLSDVPAYRQLGAMASVALLLAALAALFVLPGLLRPGGQLLPLKGMPVRQWGRRVRPVAIAMLLVMVVAGVVATQAHFDSDLANLDGTDQAVRDAEADFHETWSRQADELALVAVSARTREEAATRNDQVYDTFTAAFGAEQFISLARLCPSPARRNVNRESWRTFWDTSRIALLQQRLAEAGQPYGISAEAFEPFFAALHQPASWGDGLGPLSFVQDQFMVRGDGRWIMLNYFRDRPDLVAQARALARPLDGVQVVSRRALGQALAAASLTESRRIVLFSIVFIVAATLIMTRHLRRSVIMLLPALFGVCAVLSLHVLADLPLNTASVIAGIVVFGLCIDYGVFTVHAWQRDQTTTGHSMASVHLSSLTTLVGAGALLGAQHPALFLVAVTLNAGLAAGYAGAVVLVPSACHWLLREEQEVSTTSEPCNDCPPA